MFAGLFSDEERAKLDDKGMEALNKGAKAMLSGLRGSGSSYSYDAHGRIVESRERNFAFERSPRSYITRRVTIRGTDSDHGQ
jgi:hypothetical protein